MAVDRLQLPQGTRRNLPFAPDGEGDALDRDA